MDAGNIPVLYTDPSGVQYYRYYASLLTAVPAAVAGTIQFPRIDWVSSCHTVLANVGSVWVNGRGVLTVSGTTLVNLGPYRAI